MNDQLLFKITKLWLTGRLQLLCSVGIQQVKSIRAPRTEQVPLYMLRVMALVSSRYSLEKQPSRPYSPVKGPGTVLKKKKLFLWFDVLQMDFRFLRKLNCCAHFYFISQYQCSMAHIMTIKYIVSSWSHHEFISSIIPYLKFIREQRNIKTKPNKINTKNSKLISQATQIPTLMAYFIT